MQRHKSLEAEAQDEIHFSMYAPALLPFLFYMRLSVFREIVFLHLLNHIRLYEYTF